MNRWIGAFLLVSIAAAPAWAQHTSADTAEGFSSLARAPIRGGPYLSTIQDRFGEPILMVDYPWTVHAKASIEVAALPDDQTQWSEVRPLYYFDRLFHGNQMVAIYKCLESAANVPTRASGEKNGVEYSYVGQRNSLGKPSVVVVCRTPIAEAEPTAEKEPTAKAEPTAKKELLADRAVYPLLEPWAPDQRTLQLDLPRDFFAKQGKIRVWLLRGDAVLWSEDIAWPGFAAEGSP